MQLMPATQAALSVTNPFDARQSIEGGSRLLKQLLDRYGGDLARALSATRDPAWTADGLVSDKWLPVSPATGKLDAFEWKVPLADLTPPGQVIELFEAEPAPMPAPVPMPAPMHKVTRAVDLPRRSNSSRTVPRIIAPVAPSG